MADPIRNDRLWRDYHVVNIMIYTSKVKLKLDITGNLAQAVHDHFCLYISYSASSSDKVPSFPGAV